MSRTANQEQTVATYRRYERVFVLFYLAAVCATLGFFTRNVSLSFERAHPELKPFFSPPPVLYAPEAYRIGIPALERLFLAALPGVSWSLVLAGLHTLFGLAAVALLYWSLSRRLVGMPIAIRAVGMATFLAALHFPVEWVLPWARPETLPTGFYLAASLALLGCRRLKWLSTVLLFVLTVWQGFVRADVPFVFGVAIVLCSLLPEALRDLGPRWLNLLQGIGVIGIAAAVQLYLQMIRFPHLPHTPGTAVIQFAYNMKPHSLRELFLAMLPVLLLGLLWVGWRQEKSAGGRAASPLDSTDRLILLASALYLPVWLTVGIVGEIRIYVPFLLMIATVTGRMASAVMMQFSGCSER